MTDLTKPDVGLNIRSRERVVTAADVEKFATLTGDLHPVHLDADWARTSLFRERVAPGMLVLSFSIALLEVDYTRVLALRRLRNVVFKRPTRLGEAIHVDALITSSREIGPGIALVGLRWIVRNSADLTLLRASIEVLWSIPEDLAGREPSEPVDP